VRPQAGFDTSLTTGRGSTSLDADANPDNAFDPKAITARLSQPVDDTHFAVDPDATCGDDPSSSVAQFRVETSPDGTTWHTAATGTFNAANNGKLNVVDPTGFDTNVGWVRFTILSNQTPTFGTTCPNSPLSGCVFTDLTELAVLGSPAP
jgi:extracellular elastinolytic metalloproteinase